MAESGQGTGGGAGTGGPWKPSVPSAPPAPPGPRPAAVPPPTAFQAPPRNEHHRAPRSFGPGAVAIAVVVAVIVAVVGYKLLSVDGGETASSPFVRRSTTTSDVFSPDPSAPTATTTPDGATSTSSGEIVIPDVVPKLPAKATGTRATFCAQRGGYDHAVDLVMQAAKQDTSAAAEPIAEEAFPYLSALVRAAPPEVFADVGRIYTFDASMAYSSESAAALERAAPGAAAQLEDGPGLGPEEIKHHYRIAMSGVRGSEADRAITAYFATC